MNLSLNVVAVVPNTDIKINGFLYRKQSIDIKPVRGLESRLKIYYKVFSLLLKMLPIKFGLETMHQALLS